MLSGEKTVELRRRPMHVAPSTRVWIYSKLPRGCIEAVGVIDEVVRAPPRRIWQTYGARTGISRAEFDSYFADAIVAFAILLRDIQQLAPVLTLMHLRRNFTLFHPPQFFRRLDAGSAELNLFQSALLGQG